MNNYESQESSILGVHEDRWELVRKTSLAQLHLPRFWILGPRWAFCHTYKLFVSFFLTLEEVVNFTQIVDLCDHHSRGTEGSLHPSRLTLAMFTDSPPQSPGEHQSFLCHHRFFLLESGIPQDATCETVLFPSEQCHWASPELLPVSVAWSSHSRVCPWCGRATAHQLNPGRTSELFPSLSDCPLNKPSKQFWYRCLGKQRPTFSTKVDTGNLSKVCSPNKWKCCLVIRFVYPWTSRGWKAFKIHICSLLFSH